jgi:hypothetical protein
LIVNKKLSIPLQPSLNSLEVIEAKVKANFSFLVFSFSFLFDNIESSSSLFSSNLIGLINLNSGEFPFDSFNLLLSSCIFLL